MACGEHTSDAPPRAARRARRRPTTPEGPAGQVVDVSRSGQTSNPEATYNSGVTRCTDQTLATFLGALSNAEPTPGGGTAAAIAGAMGASLLLMVSGLARSRTNAADEHAALAAVRPGLVELRDRMLALADADSEAFNAVMAAFRLPKATDSDKAVRTRAIQEALRAATEAPLETLRTATAIGQLARAVAEHGNRSATSDVRVALELLEAAAAGATANVETNLSSLDDESYRAETAAALIDLTNTLTADTAAARAAL